jgi:hypothetical protein
MAAQHCNSRIVPRKCHVASEFLNAKPLKALTLHQPFAQLCADGRKQIETRSWSTTYRGPLAIHAGQTLDRDFAMECGYDPHTLARGAVVCVVMLRDCEPMPAMHFHRWLKTITQEEQRFSIYSPGRFAWRLQLERVLAIPHVVRGTQGLWTVAVGL